MTQLRPYVTAALTIALAFSTVACGGGAGSAADGEATASSGMPSQCPTPPFEFEIRRTGSGANETFEAVGARADMQLPLRSYKLYLTDYELDPDQSILSQVMTKPPGGMAIQVSLLTDYGMNTPSVEEWTPFKAGDVALDLNDSREKHGEPNGHPTMTLSMATDEGPTSQGSVELVATAKILYVGEDAVCVEVQATSESGIQMSGVVAGAVH